MTIQAQQEECKEENRLVKMNNKIPDEEIIRINVHKSLLEEFKTRKEEYEQKIGYKINGGTPIISQICAEILKHQRNGNKDKIVVEVQKVKGLKRVDTILL